MKRLAIAVLMTLLFPSMAWAATWYAKNAGDIFAANNFAATSGGTGTNMLGDGTILTTDTIDLNGKAATTANGTTITQALVQATTGTITLTGTLTIAGKVKYTGTSTAGMVIVGSGATLTVTGPGSGNAVEDTAAGYAIAATGTGIVNVTNTGSVVCSNTSSGRCVSTTGSGAITITGDCNNTGSGTTVFNDNGTAAVNITGNLATSNGYVYYSSYSGAAGSITGNISQTGNNGIYAVYWRSGSTALTINGNMSGMALVVPYSSTNGVIWTGSRTIAAGADCYINLGPGGKLQLATAGGSLSLANSGEFVVSMLDTTNSTIVTTAAGGTASIVNQSASAHAAIVGGTTANKAIITGPTIPAASSILYGTAFGYAGTGTGTFSLPYATSGGTATGAAGTLTDSLVASTATYGVTGSTRTGTASGGGGNVIVVEEGSLMFLAIVLLCSRLVFTRGRKLLTILLVLTLVAIMVGPALAVTRVVSAGATNNHNVTVALRDSTTGQLKPSVAYGSVTYLYQVDGSASGAGSATCVAGTAGTYSSGSWVETPAASGLYQFSLPNICEAAVGGSKVKLSSSGAIDVVVDLQVVSATQGLAGSGPTVVPSGGTVSNVTNAVVLPGTITVTGGTVSTVTGMSSDYARRTGDYSTYAGGAVASVTGNVGGSVTGGIGGNVAGNVTGSVGSVAGTVSANLVQWGGGALPTSFASSSLTTLVGCAGTMTANAVQWGGAALPTAFGVTGTASANVVQWGGSGLPTSFAVSDKTGFSGTMTVSDKTGFSLSATGWNGSSLPTSFAVSGTASANIVQWGGSTLPTAFAVSDKTGFSITSGTLSGAVTLPGTMASDYARRTGDYSTYAGGDTSGVTTLLSRVVGTLSAGAHSPQTGDTYTLANSGTYGFSAIKTSVGSPFQVGGTAPANLVQWSGGTVPTAFAASNMLTTGDIAGSVSTLLSSVHGTGSWGGSGGAGTVTEATINSLLSSIHGTGSWGSTVSGTVSANVVQWNGGATPVFPSFPANFASLVISASGSVVTGTLSSATGWGGLALPTAFAANNLPANYLSAGEQASLTAAGSGTWYSAPATGTMTEATIGSFLASAHGTGTWGSGTLTEASINSALSSVHGTGSWGSGSGALTTEEHNWLVGIPQNPLLANSALLPATVIAAKSDVAVSAGTGANPVVVTVSSGTATLQGATVRFTNGGQTYVGTTSASGTVSFSLDALTWSVAITNPGYQFTPSAFIVPSGGTTTAFSMSAVTIPASTTGFVTAYGYYEPAGVPTAGLVVSLQVTASATSGAIFNGAIVQATSDANGLVSFTGRTPGNTYRVWVGSTTTPTTSKVFTIPATQTTDYKLPALIGR
jgi:hypothetical protein